MVISAAGAVDHDALVKVGGAGSRGSKLGAESSWLVANWLRVCGPAGNSLYSCSGTPELTDSCCKLQTSSAPPPCLPPQAAEKAFSKLPAGGKTANELVKEVRRQRGGGGWAGSA